MMPEQPLIYFLCTGNSCRSQIAEGYGKALLGDIAEIHSAGLEAHGLNPKAVEVMDEDGIDIRHQESESIDKNLLRRADYVITLCGHAAEHCPAVTSEARKLHWGLPDPAKATGTNNEIHQAFQNVREEVKERIQSLRQSLLST